MTQKRCFPPVVDANTRVLVLGSLPGEVSLAQSQYYAHKQNRFWSLIGDVTEEDLSRLDYLARLQALLRHRVGLWDVVAQAQREGSLDSRIRNHASNDLVALVESLPHLAAVAFNGGTAARLGMRALQDAVGKVEFMSLPSSSPAYTLPYAQKLKAWEALRPWLVEAASVDASRSRGTESA
jgi:hypoxanthine-DNA glycosylase